MGLTVCSQLRALYRTGSQWGRLLAWIRDQVRLKAFSAQQRALYTRGGTALYLIRNNGKPIKGKCWTTGDHRIMGCRSQHLMVGSHGLPHTVSRTLCTHLLFSSFYNNVLRDII